MSSFIDGVRGFVDCIHDGREDFEEFVGDAVDQLKDGAKNAANVAQSIHSFNTNVAQFLCNMGSESDEVSAIPAGSNERVSADDAAKRKYCPLWNHGPSAPLGPLHYPSSQLIPTNTEGHRLMSNSALQYKQLKMVFLVFIIHSKAKYTHRIQHFAVMVMLSCLLNLWSCTLHT